MFAGTIVNVHFTEEKKHFVFFDVLKNTIRLMPAIPDENLKMASQHAKMLAKFLQQTGISQTAKTALTNASDTLGGFKKVGGSKKKT
jgi:hypothetical protein